MSPNSKLFSKISNFGGDFGKQKKKIKSYDNLILNTFRPWKKEEIYQEGDKVSHNGKYYQVSSFFLYAVASLLPHSFLRKICHTCSLVADSGGCLSASEPTDIRLLVVGYPVDGQRVFTLGSSPPMFIVPSITYRVNIKNCNFFPDSLQPISPACSRLNLLEI